MAAVGEAVAVGVKCAVANRRRVGVARRLPHRMQSRDSTRNVCEPFESAVVSMAQVASPLKQKG